MNKVTGVLALMLLVVLSSVLAGCAAGGIPAEQYEGVVAQLQDAQAQVADLQGQAGELETQNNSLAAELKASQEQNALLQGQIGGLKDLYELTGATPLETAEKIVKYYHETHTYSVADFYVCSDMASDVWNMLQAQGIKALIQIGDIEKTVTDIFQCDHAWVLAEVSPGSYLALEATGGKVVSQSSNPLYYKGWSFTTPKDFKRYHELLREYNVRVGIMNKLASEANAAHTKFEKAIDSYNQMVDEYNLKYSGNPESISAKIQKANMEAQLTMIDEKEDRYNQLKALADDQQVEMTRIDAEMKGLATRRP